MPPNPSATEVETLLLLQEIEDVIDESPVDFVSIEEVDSAVLKLQEQRMSLRRYDILLKSETSDSDLLAKISDTLMKIKEYIKCSKDRKQKLNLLQTKQLHEEAFRRERSTLFVITDLRRIITDLINDFRIVLEKLTDIELLQLKSELPVKCELMNKAAKKYELILQTPLSDADLLTEVKDIGEQYELMTKMKATADSLAHALSKIVNMMKEVMLLAETHKIEEYLYFGDGIQRIYAHLGDSLLSKWLSNSDETDSPKDTWLKLVEFLEKEQRLQQQKLIILNSNVNSKEIPFSKGKPPDHSHNKDKKHGFNVSSMTPICSICQAPDGTSDHTSSSGPNANIKKDVANVISFVSMNAMRDIQRANMFLCARNIRTINPTRTSLKSINGDLLEVPAYHYLHATSVFRS
eukprot:gene12202-13458_t